METNTNDTEAKQPASAGCHPTHCSVSWPIEDEYDYYENETSHLRTLVDACDLEWKGWTNIAKKLNAAHGNNRSAAACRQKFHRISSQNVQAMASADTQTPQANGQP